MRTLLAVLFASLAVDAAAGGFVAGGGLSLGPAAFGWTVPPPSILYDSLGRCLAPLGCPDYEQFRRFLERYERNYGQRVAADQPAALARLATPRDVPPTPEAQIQPRYLGASQIRAEFAQTGKPVDRQ